MKESSVVDSLRPYVISMLVSVSLDDVKSKTEEMIIKANIRIATATAEF